MLAFVGIFHLTVKYRPDVRHTVIPLILKYANWHQLQRLAIGGSCIDQNQDLFSVALVRYVSIGQYELDTSIANIDINFLTDDESINRQQQFLSHLPLQYVALE